MKKIKAEEVRRAVAEQIESIRAHLDLEGTAYVRIVRTGANECFAQDHTSDTLRAHGMSYKEMQELYWKKPACEKYD